jgi:hypothetical protein
LVPYLKLDERSPVPVTGLTHQGTSRWDRLSVPRRADLGHLKEVVPRNFFKRCQIVDALSTVTGREVASQLQACGKCFYKHPICKSRYFRRFPCRSSGLALRLPRIRSISRHKNIGGKRVDSGTLCAPIVVYPRQTAAPLRHGYPADSVFSRQLFLVNGTRAFFVIVCRLCFCCCHS